MLTATEVEQKTFSTALRGYDLDEVDDFLDEIVATLKELNDQLEEARGAGAAVKEPMAAPEPVPVPAPPPQPAIDESAIGRALVAAQTAADQLLADAQVEAGKIVDEAKGEADTWRVERDAKRAEAESEIAALASRVSSIRAELSVLAGEVAGKLDEMDAVIEGEGSTGAEPEDDADEAQSDGGAGGESADDLEEILNGVAADLQLEPDQEGESTETGAEGDASSSEDTGEPGSGT